MKCKHNGRKITVSAQLTLLSSLWFEGFFLNNLGKPSKKYNRFGRQMNSMVNKHHHVFPWSKWFCAWRQSNKTSNGKSIKFLWVHKNGRLIQEKEYLSNPTNGFVTICSKILWGVGLISWFPFWFSIPKTINILIPCLAYF